jgi:hypothetical protein
MTPEALGVEERSRGAVALEPAPDLGEQGWRSGELEGERFIVLQILRYELGLAVVWAL